MNEPICDSPQPSRPRRRRWFRWSFSLRAMFVVVTAFGVWFGWELQWVRERKATVQAANSTLKNEDVYLATEFNRQDTAHLGASPVLRQPPDKSHPPGIIAYDSLELHDGKPVSRRKPGLDALEYARVSHLRRLLGDESIIAMSLSPALPQRLIARIEKAFPEAILSVRHNGEPERNALRDSLYKPAADRQTNVGTLFKTGKFD